jgi:hypothetical protein
MEHVCESVSLNDNVHSPRPKGEDLLRQLYACDDLGIAGKKRRRTCTQKVTKQSLSDYAQQD